MYKKHCALSIQIETCQQGFTYSHSLNYSYSNAALLKLNRIQKKVTLHSCGIKTAGNLLLVTSNLIMVFHRKRNIGPI